MNKAIIIGRLTKDPELRYTQTNQAICSFTLALDRKMSRDKREEAEASNRQTADFPRIIVWGKMGENASRYLFKGSQCAVEGRIQTGSYQDRETGKTVYTTDIVAESVEYLSNSTQEGSKSNSGVNTYQGNKNQSEDFFEDDFEEIQDDGRIPF
ncbi:single-stranded DNA-binding protein [Anaerococcus sp. NML200574]|uniref:single-stranded DNA-binding protein n=1 Tax=Anaerococcus sp. NML200574 TaxID=2954486 RepID=UPI00223910A9|nr:single-stranded DNA-binding protein [Anaerococcus sp. NML200574]MCW6678187.1 single-stranded DNA-binding protein [Anaerococcus sp. NML200574]